VTAIRQAAEQASRLTQELLAFSRSQTLRPTVVDVDAAIARARHGLQRVLGAAISLETAPGQCVWAVRADADQLDQMLHHLAVHARAAMPDGGSVVVSTENVLLAAGDARCGDLPPGEYVALAVTDTGAEIQSSVQQRLFEPFFPAPEREHATGLGLAIVYGIVKQSGGHITVESPVDGDRRGSRFTVYLPATREHRASDTPDDAAADAETVLLVGDDRNVQSFIGDVLRRRGYQVIEASDSWDALRLADTHPSTIDLLIATGVHGPLVATAIQERRPSTRVLHVSASADADAADRNDRGRAFLAQPFTPLALARKVREVLDGTDVRQVRPAWRVVER
jgi:CheY-like chemotaxis protein